MAVTKLLRFEVFKRDGFQCAYCGQVPPNVILELDHINPKSEGGGDDINNLLTSCFDCNRGKRNITLQKIPSKLKENLEVLQEKELQLKEYNKFIMLVEKRIEKDIEEIAAVYSQLFPDSELVQRFKDVFLRRFLTLLPKHKIIEFLKLAASILPGYTPDQSGICWNEIKGKGKPKE